MTEERRESVGVALGKRSYDIAIGEGLLAEAGTRILPLLNRKVTAIVTDTNVARHHLANLEASLKASGIAALADTSLLETLPKRELASGYAEVAKYGLLGDKDFFAWLESAAPAIMRGDSQARIHAIRKSCEAKARIVAEDETETGVRALL